MISSTLTKVSLATLVVLVGLVYCQDGSMAKPELKRADQPTPRPSSYDNTFTNGDVDDDDDDDDDKTYNDFDSKPTGPRGPFNNGFGQQQGFSNPMGGLFSPFNGGGFPFGQPRRQPDGGMLPRPSNFLSDLLGGADIFAPFRRTHEMFERHLKDLSKTPGGYSEERFYRNGVAYVRTCTTKRIDNNRENGQGDQKQQQQQQQQLEGPQDQQQDRPNQSTQELGQQQQQQQQQQQLEGLQDLRQDRPNQSSQELEQQQQKQQPELKDQKPQQQSELSDEQPQPPKPAQV